MKKNIIHKFLSILLSIAFVGTAMGQETVVSKIRGNMQYFRANDKTGINIYEPTKADTNTFDGMKVRIGGNFTQNFQALQDKNNATAVYDANGVNTNQLMGLTNGFNLAMANLRVDGQLADGIRVNLTMYLSSRHHSETWVKGGYLQFDKLLFLKSAFIDSLMKSFTIKAGDYEVDYGDQHFRRSDGGNAIYNPFIENYIMDEFATEIGTEVYFHPKNGIIAMFGVSNGELNPTVVAATAVDPRTNKLNKYDPAFHGKIGYDKQLKKDLRVRLTGSFYAVKSSNNNTLFNGDRTGSNYFLVMENTTATSGDNAWSGRLNPGFSQQVTTFMVNPFMKFKGIEFFGTYEIAKGRTIKESNLRTTTQYAVDLIYRFPREKENFWIGARFNSVTAALQNNPDNVTVNRIAGTVGWFATKNIMLKAEYVAQQYNNYASTNILSGGQFSGIMLQGSVAF